jgi:hypothetical protein
VAGFNSTNPLPKTLKQAMLLLIAYWYENRETVIVGVGTISKEAEFAVAQLLALTKAGWFLIESRGFK